MPQIGKNLINPISIENEFRPRWLALINGRYVMLHHITLAITVTTLLLPNVAKAQTEIDDLTGALLVTRDDGRLFRQLDDMLIEVQGAGTLSVKPRTVRLWPKGVLPISFDPAYPQAQRQIFFEACGWWSRVAKIECVPRTKQKSYIYIQLSNNNSSYVGRIGGKQKLNLFNRNSRGIIAHEIAHALGFTHQHNSPDRNNYVRILWKNIKDSAKPNFSRMSSAVVFGRYDYCSIMHYSVKGFSKNGDPTIIVLREPGCLVGQRTAISEGDKLGMMATYGARGGDESLIDVPDLVGRFSRNNGPHGIFQEFGLRSEVQQRYDNGRLVSRFATPDLRTASCDTRVTEQSPQPTRKTGKRVRFNSVIRVTISRTCMPNPDGFGDPDAGKPGPRRHPF